MPQPGPHTSANALSSLGNEFVYIPNREVSYPNPDQIPNNASKYDSKAT